MAAGWRGRTVCSVACAAAVWFAASASAAAAPVAAGEALDAELAVLAARPGPERLVHWLKRLSYMPYRRDPLGDGADAPYWAFDRGADCVTFVDTAVALTAAADAAQAEAWMRHLRYGNAAPSHGSRLHLPEVQWVPGLERAGVIDGWFAAPYMRVVHVNAGARGSADVPVAPPGALERGLRDAMRRYPAVLAFVVAEPRSDRPFAVLHVGFVVTVDGQPKFVHASRRRGKVTWEAPVPGWRSWIRAARRRPPAGVAFAGLRFRTPGPPTALDAARPTTEIGHPAENRSPEPSP